MSRFHIQYPFGELKWCVSIQWSDCNHLPLLSGLIFMILCLSEICKLESSKPKAFRIHFAMRACKASSGSMRLSPPMFFGVLTLYHQTLALACVADPDQRKFWRYARICLITFKDSPQRVIKYHKVGASREFTMIRLLHSSFYLVWFLK